jgi:hypothetical protein
MTRRIILLVLCLISFYDFCFSQPVPIQNYSVNSLGQVLLSIQAQAGKYYMLHAKHNPAFNWATSMTMGISGTMVISESVGAYPLKNYSITEHDIAVPDDYDGDGIDNVTEFNNMPTDAPFNFTDPIELINGPT